MSAACLDGVDALMKRTGATGQGQACRKAARTHKAAASVTARARTTAATIATVLAGPEQPDRRRSRRSPGPAHGRHSMHLWVAWML